MIGIIVGVVLARCGRANACGSLRRPGGGAQATPSIDQGTGRVDFYDTMSRRTGYGRVDGVGKVERFGPDGKRQGETAVPVVAQGRSGPVEGGYSRPGRRSQAGRGPRTVRAHLPGRPDMITDIASYLRFFDSVRRRTERDVAALPPAAAAWRPPAAGGEAGWSIGADRRPHRRLAALLRQRLPRRGLDLGEAGGGPGRPADLAAVARDAPPSAYAALLARDAGGVAHAAHRDDRHARAPRSPGGACS